MCLWRIEWINQYFNVLYFTEVVFLKIQMLLFFTDIVQLYKIRKAVFRYFLNENKMEHFFV